MVRILIGLLILALPLCALAQEQEAAPAPKAAYTDYSAAGFGFALKLPSGGTIEDPTTEGWAEEPEVAFSWYSATDQSGKPKDPVVMIQARVNSFGTEIDPESFAVFCEDLLGYWKADTAKYTVVTGNESVPMGNTKWNVIEIEDASDQNGKIYYSVFSTYAGDSIYTVTLYYLAPVNDSVRNFGAPVLQGFKLTAPKPAAPAAPAEPKEEGK